MNQLYTVLFTDARSTVILYRGHELAPASIAFVTKALAIGDDSARGWVTLWVDERYALRLPPRPEPL